MLDELLTERDEVAAQRKALGEAVRVLQDAAKASFTLSFLLFSLGLSLPEGLPVYYGNI